MAARPLASVCVNFLAGAAARGRPAGETGAGTVPRVDGEEATLGPACDVDTRTEVHLPEIELEGR